MGRQCKTIFIKILNINILFTIHEKDINNTEKVGKTSNDFRPFHNYLMSIDFFLKLSWLWFTYSYKTSSLYRIENPPIPKLVKCKDKCNVKKGKKL